MDINNREIATIIWFSITFTFLMTKKEIRLFFPQLFQILMNKQVIIVFSASIIWATIFIVALREVGLWSSDNLKTTLVWGITFAFATLFDMKKIEKDNNYFKEQIKSTLKITAILTFILELQSFSLIAELIIIPIIFMISAMIVVGEKNEKNKSTTTFLKYILSFIVIIYFIHSLYVSLTSFSETFTKKNLTEFLTPIILSLTYLPFVYILHIYQRYEMEFIGLKFRIDNESLYKKAKLMSLLNFRSDIDGLHRWVRETNNLKKIEELKAKVDEIKKRKHMEAHPSLHSELAGWPPSSSRFFLQDINLTTNDYHPTDDEWWASSSMLEIGDDACIADNIAYYIYGNERSVTKLKLRAHINNLPISEKSDTFINIAILTLTRKALINSEIAIPDFKEITGNKIIKDEGYSITLEKENFIGGISGYTFNLIIEVYST
ncbi:hypothetical protein V6301_11150 [Serratia marcescens]|uniref:hypothetical protein n=1 Tax=Serratia marcescens TaxID=615 RepID=UPI0037017200